MVLDTLRALSMEARKKKSPTLTFLSMLQSEIVNVGKNNGNRETTEEEAIAVLKKIRNTDVQVKEKSVGSGRSDMASRMDEEIRIIDLLLPEQMDEEMLKKAVDDIIAKLVSNGIERDKKMMGKVIGELKAQYAGKYDGKTASDIVKAALL